MPREIVCEAKDMTKMPGDNHTNQENIEEASNTYSSVPLPIFNRALVGTTTVINRWQFSNLASFFSSHLMDQSEQSRYIDALL
jgi:hypothetical protein